MRFLCFVAMIAGTCALASAPASASARDDSPSFSMTDEHGTPASAIEYNLSEHALVPGDSVDADLTLHRQGTISGPVRISFERVSPEGNQATEIYAGVAILNQSRRAPLQDLLTGQSSLDVSPPTQTGPLALRLVFSLPWAATNQSMNDSTSFRVNVTMQHNGATIYPDKPPHEPSHGLAMTGGNWLLLGICALGALVLGWILHIRAQRRNRSADATGVKRPGSGTATVRDQYSRRIENTHE